MRNWMQKWYLLFALACCIGIGVACNLARLYLALPFLIFGYVVFTFVWLHYRVKTDEEIRHQITDVAKNGSYRSRFKIIVGLFLAGISIPFLGVLTHSVFVLLIIPAIFIFLYIRKWRKEHRRHHVIK
jgi:hypothetical protein